MAIATNQEMTEQNADTFESGTSTAVLAEGPLTDEEVGVFRQQLMQLREWLVRGIADLEDRASMAIAHSRLATDADNSGDGLWQQSLVQQAVADKRMQLHEVMQAFGRISNNTYGKCIAKNCHIDRTLLSEIPWAKYCPSCAARH